MIVHTVDLKHTSDDDGGLSCIWGIGWDLVWEAVGLSHGCCRLGVGEGRYGVIGWN